MMPNPQRPMDGILVVSLEQAVAAPVCTARLADAGARVIKVERKEGDFARGYDQVVKGEASYFVWANRDKESIVLDFKDEQDAAFLHILLSQADVFIQNLAPGATGRVGFGSKELRAKYPRLITCDISGYGESGPYRDMKAYDLLVQSESGLVSVSGAPDAQGRIGVSICDIGAGMNALIGIQQALYQRERTGSSTGVKVSLFDTVADWMTVPLMHYDYGGKELGAVGLRHPSIAPYSGYRTSDGEMLVIAIQNEREWQTFCEKILEQPGLATDPRFASNNARVVNRSAMDKAIDAVFASHTRSVMEQKLKRARIAYGAVNSIKSLSNHPQLRRWSVTLPSGEDVQIVAPPVRLESQQEKQFGRVPALGEQTDQIRAEFSVER